MHGLANINGEIMPLAEARISALDRGFLFGDAVYEVVRVYHGRPWLLDEHLERLRQSLASIRIAGVDLAVLKERALATVRHAGFQEALLYIHITRGAAPRQHEFPGDVQPLEFLYVQPFDDPYEGVRTAGVRAITLPDIRWQRCDIKSTNLLPNVLAAQAAREAGAFEAIFYLPDGTLTEGTRTSLFGVRAGQIWTAPTSQAILPGITRRLILDLARQARIPVVERVLYRQELAELSELFLTGTTCEIVPVIVVDEQRIHDATPGPITRQLQAAYRDATRTPRA
ncbi:MAG: aminotransferase IV [Gemmataceae bacterium]